MDRKSIITLAVTALLFVTWPMFVNKIYPPVPAPKRTNAPSLGTNQIATTTIGENTNRAGTIVANAFAMTNAPVGKEENITIENRWGRYHFSSIGGGLTLIELKEFKSYVGCKADKMPTNPPAALNRKSPVPMFML